MNIAAQTDIFTALAEVEWEANDHAPDHFHTQDRWTPFDLRDAYTQWKITHNATTGYRGCRLWDIEITDRFGLYRGPAPAPEDLQPHTTVVVNADLRCTHHGIECQCVGNDLLYRAWCATCSWWTPPHTSEREAIAASLDHCWPGWRELPLFPHRVAGPSLNDMPADYPTDWQTPGAPVRTIRKPMGTRPVQGRSPFGGWDYGVLTETTHQD